MKITFAEFKQWHETAWPKNYIWCGDTTLPDGRDIYADGGGLNEAIGDAEMVDLANFEGFELEDRTIAGDDIPVGLSVTTLIRRWRKEQANVMVVVTVPKADMGKFKDVCRANGWKMP